MKLHINKESDAFYLALEQIIKIAALLGSHTGMSK